MHDPYKMIFVNLITSGILFGSLIVFKLAKPKKKINLFLILVLLSILPVINNFRPGSYESGDFNTHVYRNMSFYQALTEGQLKPTWSRDLNATYGYPTFLIEAPLGDYIPSLFHFLGFTFIDSLKILLSLSFIMSGVTMYLWLKNKFSEVAGFVGGVFYLFAPYHLIDMHFRVSPGDMLAFIFTPLILFFIDKISQNGRIIFIFLGGVSIALLLLSHPISLAGMILTLIYSLFVIATNKNKILLSLKIGFSFLIGFALSAYYFIPVILEKTYIITSLMPTAITFQDFWEFLYSPWRYGFLFQGPKGEYSFLIGYIELVTIIIGLFIVIKEKKFKNKNILIFFLSCFFVFFFLMQKISFPLWKILPLLANFSSTYRLMFVLIIFVAAIGGIVVNKLNKKWITILFCFIAIFSTIINWGNRRVIPEINDAALYHNLPNSTVQGEGGPAAMPKWVDPNHLYMKDIPLNHLEVINGKANVSNLKRTSIQHDYLVTASTNIVLKENTLYFPNWTVYANNKEIPINYTNKKFPGVINFKLDKGTYRIHVEFKETRLRMITGFISSLSWLVVIFALLTFLINNGSFKRRLISIFQNS